jgi:hypothetical protein
VDVLSIVVAVGLLVAIGWRVRLLFGPPRPPRRRKPSINSGRTEKAALFGGILAALFLAGHNHHKEN